MKLKTVISIASVVVPAVWNLIKSSHDEELNNRYYDVIGGLADRYRRMVIAQKSNSNFVFTDEMVELVRFCDAIKEEAENKVMPLTKLNRWLGYTQGRVIAFGLTSVEDERDFTRPMLRPLDFG